MAVILADGFEWITGTSQINLGYEDCPTATLAGTTSAEGRVMIPLTRTRHGSSVQTTGGYGGISSTAQVHFLKSVNQLGTAIMGAGIRDDDRSARYVGLFMFRDGSTDQIVVGRGPAWEIVVCRGNGRTGADSHLLVLTELGRSAPNAVSPGAWFFLEAKVTFHGTTGSVEIRVNETTVLTLLNKNTIASANAWCTAAGIGREYWYSIGGAATGDDTDSTVVCVDDFYVADTTGASANDFLGDSVYWSGAVSGAGTYTEFSTVYGAGTHYEAVDEAGFHDADGTYVESSTVGHRDSFVCADSPFSSVSTVHCAQVEAVARKSGAGARSIESLVRLSATDSAGSHKALGDSYQKFVWVHHTDPSGAGWTLANANSAEFGVAVAA